MSRRAVIVDPCGSGDVGHHSDVNHQLLRALAASGWAAELWDGERLEGCGYLDPRHWADLGGNLHLAKLCEQQLQKAQGGGSEGTPEPVGAWILHTALPFQLLGLARFLSHQAPAAVMVSLMFPPGETLEGATADPEAEALARVALVALAQAAREGGHRLEIWCPAQQTLELYQPLLTAAGLEATGIHGAVVGAGVAFDGDGVETGTGVLLHWGDLKPGKGRGAALAVVQELLDGREAPVSLRGARWLFHAHSREQLPDGERELLDRATQELEAFQWIEGRVEAPEMQRRLAGCTVALLAYDPEAYGQRSSGLLWCYGAARLAEGAPAVAVGHGSGWLAREAAELGISWHVGEWDWLGALGAARRTGSFTAYGRAVLGFSFAEQMVERLGAA